MSSSHYCKLGHEQLEEEFERRTRFRQWRTAGTVAALVLILGLPISILMGGTPPMFETTDPHAEIKLLGMEVRSYIGGALR